MKTVSGNTPTAKALLRFKMLGKTLDPNINPGTGGVPPVNNYSYPNGEQPSEFLAVIEPGAGYAIGDFLAISAEETWVANTHGDAATFRMFREKDDGSNQEEIFNGAPFNTNPSTSTNQTFQAGDGTGVEIDLYNGTINIV